MQTNQQVNHHRTETVTDALAKCLERELRHIWYAIAATNLFLIIALIAILIGGRTQ